MAEWSALVSPERMPSKTRRKPTMATMAIATKAVLKSVFKIARLIVVGPIMLATDKAELYRLIAFALIRSLTTSPTKAELDDVKAPQTTPQRSIVRVAWT